MDTEQKTVQRLSITRGQGVDLGFRTQLTSTCEMESFKTPLRPSSDRYLDRLSSIGKDLVKAIAAVEGVTQISVHVYDMTVYLGRAFTWDDDVGPKVVNAATEVFAANGYDLKSYAPAMLRSTLLAELESDAHVREKQAKDGSIVSSMSEDLAEGKVAAFIRELIPRIKELTVLD